MTFYGRWKFTILLAAGMLVFATRMAISGSPAEEVLLDIVGAILLVAGLTILCDDRRYRALALILGCPGILLGLVSHALPLAVASIVHLVGRGSATVLLGFTVTVLVRAVITARSVTWDTISAALVGYVIIAIIWTQIYCALELARPGSFAVASSSADQLDDFVQRQALLEYFSFATLTTLGYGDVTPISRPARSLACLEAICGQLYLAVLVAGLVGMRGTRPDSPA